VQGLALSAPGLRLLVGTTDEFAPARRRLHDHAIRTGIVARALAATDAEGERALAAGLVHNLGLTLISLYATDEFSILVQAAARGEQLAPYDHELLALTHPQ